jgi:hypothetical protein
MIVSEESGSCGQRGRMCRVFWRDDVPWVLVRLHDGVMLSLPWSWTDLPVLHADDNCRVDEAFITLLSPAALRDLARFVRGHRQRERQR